MMIFPDQFSYCINIISFNQLLIERTIIIVREKVPRSLASTMYNCLSVRYEILLTRINKIH